MTLIGFITLLFLFLALKLLYFQFINTVDKYFLFAEHSEEHSGD